jgi:hypothetical protein
MMRARVVGYSLLCAFAMLLLSLPSPSQVVTVTVQGRVYDSTGAVIPDAQVSAVNTATSISRTATTDTNGSYQIALLPVGDYEVTVNKRGFQKQVKKVHLDVGQVGAVNFTLPLGEVTQEIKVVDVGVTAEPTRTMVSSVIDENKIENLPVNGRQFIDFALLAPGVTIGDTTSGSTDVIIEPVTKLSFAGQNIHYNFVAIDGADDISTASGVQKYTPSQDAVREFRVINSDYSSEFGRAVGGIVDIITKSGTNAYHGSAYEYFRNDVLDAKSLLASRDPFSCAVPGVLSSGGCRLLDKLRQNQYGFTLGGPIQKDKTFFFANYEGQRRSESPYYNSIILNNIGLINQFKSSIGFPAENLNVTRSNNYDDFLVKLDHSFSQKEYMYVRYFFDDGRLRNYSPLNDGSDLPSGFKNNFSRDQSVVGSLTSIISPSLVNEVRMQYAKRSFDFPTVTAEPHMEVANQFAIGVNRGNPDFYNEGRFELVDNVSKTTGRHTISFGGDFNHVNTTESFPLFYPFEATFVCIAPDPTNPSSPCNSSNLLQHTPVVLWMERFQAPNFNESFFNPSVFQMNGYPQAIRNQASGTLGHTYDGFYVQDRFSATQKLTLTLGTRFDFETWPSNVLNNPHGVDPRFGFAYNVSESHSFVIRGGFGLFHGMIPSPLLMCQEPSCGGTAAYGKFRAGEDNLNSTSQLFGYSGFFPAAFQQAFNGLINGQYPDPNNPATLGVLKPATIVRFTQDHKIPYGIQSSLGVEFQPYKDAVLNISYLRTHGVHLGSFFNINQPAPSGQVLVHDSKGDAGVKNTFFCPVSVCGAPGVPGAANPAYFTYFEADSRWYSEFDGLLVNLNKRVSHHVGYGISYTWSKTLDNGPNPSFVLIPQDSGNFGAEKALSADDVRHRFVGSMTLAGPTHMNALLNDFEFSTIVTLESPHYFTKFVGFDANGDGFPLNDRVGIEPRNTFRGDSYQTVDLRLSRTFNVNEKVHLQGMAEAFNALNNINIRYFNTVYGAPDFIPAGTPGTFLDGSPNPGYGTPRAVFAPRQIQLALRVTF